MIADQKNQTHYTHVLTLFLLMMIPLFLAVLVFGYVYYRYIEPAYSTYGWKSAAGVIEEVRGGYRSRRDGESSRRFWRDITIRYTFSVDGREFSSDQIYLFTNSIDHSFLDRYFSFGEELSFEEGDAVTVYHHPERERWSVLIQGPAPASYRTLFWTGTILLVVEFALLLGFYSNFRAMKLKMQNE